MQASQGLCLSIHEAKGKKLIAKLAPVCFKKYLSECEYPPPYFCCGSFPYIFAPNSRFSWKWEYLYYTSSVRQWVSASVRFFFYESHDS